MTLSLQGVTQVVAGEVHLHPTTLSLSLGSLNVLLGPTRAGKTTLLRLLAGLDRPSAGRILVDGQDVTGVSVRRRSVAMVYQQFINYPTLTAYENIASPLRVRGASRAEIERRVAEAARLLRLEPYLQRRPLELSGGQQQRTAIARALVRDATLVLMDEPLANLDYKLREELREELPRLFAASGAVFVYATTEPAEALLLGGNVATLSQGRVTQFGASATVFRRPDDLATARVFSDPPLNEALVNLAGGLATLPGGQSLPATGALDGLPEGAYTLGIRAYDLSLDPVGSGAVALPAMVRLAEVTGSETFVHCALPGGLHWVVAAAGVRLLEPGPVTIWLDPRRVLAFDAAGRLAAAPALAAAA